MLNRTLRELVAQSVGLVDATPLQLVQVSSAGATGAIILHAWLPNERHARAVIKTPRDARLDHALEREWSAVQVMQQHAALRGRVPAALARIHFAGATFFVYEGAPGKTMYSLFRNRIFRSRASLLARFASQALDAATCIHATRTRRVSSGEVAADLLDDLGWLERTLRGFPSTVASSARAMAERIAQTPQSLPVGRVHGDFSPYNLLTTDTSRHGTAAVIDWEHSEPERPQHLDVFRFIGACGLMGLRGRRRQEALRQLGRRDPGLSRDLLRPWLERMTPAGARHWLEPHALEALWWHYLVHAARREQERRASPDDFRDSTYVAALSLLATQVEARRYRPSSACAAT